MLNTKTVLPSNEDNEPLPRELLALVLQKLEPAAVLQSYALTNKHWNAAAALSMGSISISGCTQAKADALSAWLQTHGQVDPKVGSNSLAVRQLTVCSWYRPQLLLPKQHLTALQHLHLQGISVSTAGAAAPAPVLDVFSASLMTSLVLERCQVGLQSLPALTGLKHLHIAIPDAPQDAAASNAAIVVDAIPQLLQLTSLQLGGPASQDAALAHISSLTALQQLQLIKAQCTTASFQQLPSSLTLVSINGMPLPGLVGDEQAPDLVLSPSSSPGLCNLPALADLTVSQGGNRYRAHVEMLSTLTRLTKLSLSSCDIMAGPGEPTLVLLTSLKHLQHLELHSFSTTRPPAIMPADFAAITSSPQLTYLDLNSVVEPEQATVLFSPQRQLPSLQSLTLNFYWLEDCDDVESIVTCCPNLRSLKIDSTGGDEVAALIPTVWAQSLNCLTALTGLTSLNMSMLEVALSAEVGAALVALTGLRELSIDSFDCSELGTLMQLTACKQLDMLFFEDFELMGEGGTMIINTAPLRAPSNVWQQIPSEILTAAATHFERYPDKTQHLYPLLWAAALASKGAAENQLELEQRVCSLEQQMAEVHSNMAAVLARLQLPGVVSAQQP